MANELDNYLNKFNCEIYRIIENDGVMIQMVHNEHEYNLVLWNTGWHPSKESAITRTIKHFEECEQMNVFSTNLFPYLEGLMIKDKPVTMTIRSVTQEEVASQRGNELKIIVHFKERDKALILNKTNTKQIVKFFGPETTDWHGKKITLFAEQGTWFGKTGWAVRVADKLPKQTETEADKIARAADKVSDEIEQIVEARAQKQLFDDQEQKNAGAYDEEQA